MYFKYILINIGSRKYKSDKIWTYPIFGYQLLRCHKKINQISETLHCLLYLLYSFLIGL